MTTQPLAPPQVQTRTMFEFKNVKQNYFHDCVLKAIAKLLPFRHFFYGGAIRGGKTFVCLFLFIRLARMFPGSRWHVIREDNPALESTTIPSTDKLIGKIGADFVWKKRAGNVHIVFANGSKIFFVSENVKQDRDLNWLLGLETNGIMLEQMESLNEKTYSMAIQRIGSWYIEPMPIPVLLGTFNPTPLWPKKLVYDKSIKNELKDQVLYVEALPDDNPFVTDEQWLNWQNLDELSYNQMIKSIWVFDGEGNQFAYSFRYDKHVIDVSKIEGRELMRIQKNLPVYLIFDFNVDPITCLVAQRNGVLWGKVIKEYRLRNSNIFELLEQIKNDLADYFLVCTGDASGRQRSALVKGNRTFIQTIQNELHLSAKQMQFPASNPSINNSRIVLNSLLSKHQAFHISSECLYLIDDLQTVKTDGKGGIEKKNDEKNKLKTHLLDNLRYFTWNYFRSFINVKF